MPVRHDFLLFFLQDRARAHVSTLQPNSIACIPKNGGGGGGGGGGWWLVVVVVVVVSYRCHIGRLRVFWKGEK
jgi:hypothetical protein